MSTKKIYYMPKTIVAAALLMAVAVFLASQSIAYAQTTTTVNGTTYTIPTGYQPYNYGVYYNSGTGLYYNPFTGQYSSTVPLGPASRDASGNYIIPSGYSSSVFGTYYNSTTGLYYDPATGFYSNTQPMGPSYPQMNPPVQNQNSGYYTAPNGLRYSVPVGYQQSSAGVYYNSASGTYFNPVTGQYSTTLPLGPATIGPSGAPNLPAGYSSSVYGTYYNPTTGLYYDPSTGFYSNTQPLGPTFYTGQIITVPPAVINPIIPNTGAGGALPVTLSFLALALAVTVGGGIYLARSPMHKA